MTALCTASSFVPGEAMNTSNPNDATSTSESETMAEKDVEKMDSNAILDLGHLDAFRALVGK